MDKEKILKNLDELTKNAIFRLSLTSKELFHSNFWAWLLDKYPQIFTKVFYKEYDGTSDVKVLREKNNFDLSLKINNEFIIIENKIKCIPEKEQLNRYWEKVETENKKLILISYFNPLFTKENNWEFLSYEDLHIRLKNENLSIIEHNDRVIINNYLECIELLNRLQENIKWLSEDKLGDLWKIIKDKDIQSKLNEINFEKTFQRIFSTKLTLDILKNFEHKEKLNITINCGQDLRVYSDLVFHFLNEKEGDKKRDDLIFLGVSIWGDDYRYYAGLHKKECGITKEKEGRKDANNKDKAYKYLEQKYSWFLNNDTNKNMNWNGYSYEKEMYLYKKVSISEYSIKELAQKVINDLNKIYKTEEKRIFPSIMQE